MDGPWGWKTASGADLLYLHEKLTAYERRTWDEAYSNKGSGLKHIKLANMPDRAVRRLEDLGLDDVEGLYEFTLSNRQRVWGIRVDNICYLLWWDPDHDVYPTEKRNT